MKKLATVSLLQTPIASLCLLLAACGGDGAGGAVSAAHAIPSRAEGYPCGFATA